jgi:hypothetical protein
MLTKSPIQKIIDSSTNKGTKMNLTNRAADRAVASEVTSDFVEAIRGIQIIKGMESMEASAYTLGYLESFFVSRMLDLPAKYRNEILKEMRTVTLDKLNATKELV